MSRRAAMDRSRWLPRPQAGLEFRFQSPSETLQTVMDYLDVLGKRVEAAKLQVVLNRIANAAR